MSEAMPAERLKGLNSLRFFAFFAIFLFHSFPLFSIGYLGVDFFFVLSSFLLTYLAMQEIKNTGSFSIKHFFIRRALRIFPLYYLVIIFLILLLPLLGSLLAYQIKLPAHPSYYFVFLGNLDHSDHLFALKFLWSIAVEEQFYILFLLLSIFFTRSIWIAIAILFASYIAYMLFSDTLKLDTYSHVVAHFANFGIGMILAWIYFQKRQNLLLSIIFCIVSLFLSLMFVDHLLVFNISFSIFVAAGILVMIDTFKRYDPWMSKLFYPTEILGKYSYGLYVYSGIIISLGKVLMPIPNSIVAFIVNLILLLALAIGSYHLFEKRFIDMKRKYY